MMGAPAGSLRNLLRRLRLKPLRLMLVLLQVVLGTLMLTLALTIYVVEVTGQDSRELFSVTAMTPGHQIVIQQRPFTQSTLADVLALAPDAEAVALHSPLHYRPQIEVAGERYMFPQAAQVSPNYFELMGLELVYGSFFTEQEVRENRRVVVLEEEVAEIIFGGEDPVGQEVTLLPFSPGSGVATRYAVIGTFRDPLEQSGRSGALSRYPALFPADPRGSANLVIVSEMSRGSAARTQTLAAARQIYAGWLRQFEGADFFVAEGDRPFSFFQTINPNLVLFGLFGVISLILASVGVFSATVVDMVERTREIGIRRALGANRKRIGVDIVMELGILALLGGLAGVVGAAALLPFVQTWAGAELFNSHTLYVQPLLGLMVLVLVVGVSLVLGLMPALQAGRMKPVEALREA